MYGRYNSTIGVKKKICIRCGKMDYWFSRRRCKSCSTIEDTIARMEQENQEQGDGLPELIAEADILFSRLVRLSAADKHGFLHCYICDARLHWKEAQNMHFISRANSFLRYDHKRNCRAGCKVCNEYLSGNLVKYRERLEAEMPGLVDILEEEARIPYKLGREEVRQVIAECTLKLKRYKI